MKFRKSDWTLVQEAEQNGLAVAMTRIVERIRTAQNEEFSQYFRDTLPNYSSTFDDEEGEDILYVLNDYLKSNNIEKQPLSFPLTSGTNIYLVPISENIQLKIMVVDEYYGDGESAKYVVIDFFIINEHTTKEEADILIQFVQKYLA